MLSRTQAEPGIAVKQEQEENSRNHIQTVFSRLCISLRQEREGAAAAVGNMMMEAKAVNHHIPYQGPLPLLPKLISLSMRWLRRGYSIRKRSKVYYNLPFADVSLGECRIFQLLKSIGNHTNSPLSVGRRLLGAANTAPAPMRMRAKMESFIFLET